jgi:hypothetical protein
MIQTIPVIRQRRVHKKILTYQTDSFIMSKVAMAIQLFQRLNKAGNTMICTISSVGRAPDS